MAADHSYSCTKQVIEKYRLAGAICNGAVRSVVQKAGERGATLSQLCMTGDECVVLPHEYLLLLIICLHEEACLSI